jgi:uncharacterized protein YqeY
VLRERLDTELKAAMRERDAMKISVIRLVKSAILAQETKGTRTTLDDDGILQVITKEVKERRESAAEFEKAGRSDLVAKAEDEIRLLQEFLPQQLSRDELEALVNQAIQETSASGPRDMGKVMGWLTPRTRGRADGRQVSELVKSRLPS